MKNFFGVTLAMCMTVHLVAGGVYKHGTETTQCERHLKTTQVSVLRTRSSSKPRPSTQVTTGKVISKDGTTIAFDELGKGPVVILITGALSDRSATAKLAELLSPHFTVINYDRRGRGESGDVQPYTVDREVEDLEALIDHAGGSAFLFGTSSGAALALEAARQLPRKVRKQALFEPPFISDNSRAAVPADFPSQLAGLVSSGRRGAAVELFMTKGVGLSTEVVAQMRSSPMWSGLEKLAHTLAYDMSVMGDNVSGKPLPDGRWTSVKASSLVMDGEKSDAWIRHSAAALAAILPRSEHRSLAGQNHTVASTAPQVLVPILVKFFSD